MSASLLCGAQNLHVRLLAHHVRRALPSQVHHTMLSLILVPLRLDPASGVELLQDIVVLCFCGQDHSVVVIFRGLLCLAFLDLVSDDGGVRRGAGLAGGVIGRPGRQAKQRHVVVLRGLHADVVKNLGSKIILLGLPAVNRFFQRSSQNEAIHQDFLGLPNPPGSFPSLLIDLRIPLWIIQDQSICAHKVHPDTPNAGCGEHAKSIRLGVIEFVDSRHSVRRRHRAVHTLVRPPTSCQSHSDDFYHLVRLAEHHNTVPLFVPLLQNRQQHKQLARPVHRPDVLGPPLRRSIFQQEIRVVTEFSQASEEGKG
mmetsp:Transcript_36587/g.77680  ORF Transcript_36587/g.77680 Transcript_36587/m.77680 type:complete len:311 (-) Transcript_36587:268-1200(-)